MLQKCLPCSSCSASACAWHKPLNRMFSQGSSSTLPSSKTLLSWWCRNFSLGWRWKDEKWPKILQITLSFARAFLLNCNYLEIEVEVPRKKLYTCNILQCCFRILYVATPNKTYQNSKHGIFMYFHPKWIQIACPTIFEFDLSSPVKNIHPMR